MSNEFIREARYVVLKSADVMKCLTVSELIELRRIQAKVEEHRAEIGKPPLDCVVVESDWPEYEPTWRAIEARATGAQPAPENCPCCGEPMRVYSRCSNSDCEAVTVTPEQARYNKALAFARTVATRMEDQTAPSFADAYQGAMEEVAIWKKRALEAEDLNRKFIAEINGPTHMGEPAQPAPSVPDEWLPVPEKHPTFDPVDLQLSDGSVLCGCVPQADGDYWWEGPSGEVFIDPKYANVTHWRLAADPLPDGE